MDPNEPIIDPEIIAMDKIAKAIEKLDPEARVRVLDWAWQRYMESDPEDQIGGTD
jgi:hypothetical protein